MSRQHRPWHLTLLLAIGLLVASCAPAATAAPTNTPIPPAATAVPATIAAATVAAPTDTAVPATATDAATPTPATITLVDSLSHTVTLAGPAQHIVALAPSDTEILYAIGAGSTLVGRDDFSDFPPEVSKIPSIGSEYPHVNSEAIVALHPDLVLAAGVTSPDDVDALIKLGLTVYATSNAGSLDDIYHDIAQVGALVGQDDAAKTLVTTMQGRVDAVKTKVAALNSHPIVFYEIDATDPAKPWTAGPGSFIDQLITLAAGNNAGDIAKDQYAQLSLEQLVSENPDIIVLGSATFGGQTPALVAARPGWGSIKAVKNNAVYTFDDNLVSRPGPRVVDGLEKLAALIHPESFK